MKNTIIILLLTALGMTYVMMTNAKDDKLQSAKLAQSFDVASGGTLTLDANFGSIEVQSHDSDTVEVLVKKKGRGSEDYEVTFEHDGDNVKIIGDKNSSSNANFKIIGIKNASSIFNFLNVNFIVKIPNNYNVDLRTSGGSIDLQALNGDVKADTSGGSISFDKIKGDVNVKTAGGSIEVGEVDGGIKAHTSGGNININVATQPAHDRHLTTSGGNIVANLAKDIKLDLYARTNGGIVSSQVSIKGSASLFKIEGDINGGGPKLTLETNGGIVRIKEL